MIRLVVAFGLVLALAPFAAATPELRPDSDGACLHYEEHRADCVRVGPGVCLVRWESYRAFSQCVEAGADGVCRHESGLDYTVSDCVAVRDGCAALEIGILGYDGNPIDHPLACAGVGPGACASAGALGGDPAWACLVSSGVCASPPGGEATCLGARTSYDAPLLCFAVEVNGSSSGRCVDLSLHDDGP